MLTSPWHSTRCVGHHKAATACSVAAVGLQLVWVILAAVSVQLLLPLLLLLLLLYLLPL